MSLAENLKKYRKLRGISRKEIADKLNMRESSYGYYEQGRTKPDAAKLATIADILQVPVNELLDTNDNLEYYISTWQLAGYDVTVKDDNNIYITEFKPLSTGFLSGLLDNHLPLEEQEAINKHKKLMDRIKGVTFSKKDFISVTKSINDDSFAEALQISKKAIEKAFLLRALEESTAIAAT